jgi:opacity protein-like surface antigen
MKRILTVIAVASFVTCGTASAADLPVRAAPVPPSTGCCDWTGVYVGLHTGGGRGDTSITLDNGNATFPGQVDKNGWLVGVQLGANYQLPGTFVVFGTEFSLSKTWIDGSKSEPCFAGASLEKLSCFAEDQWLLLAMARLGIAPTSQFLAYIQVGVGVAGITTNLQPIGVGGLTPNFQRSSVVHDGLAFGAGVDYQWQTGSLGCCRYWVLGADWVRVNLKEKTHENVNTRHVSQDLDIFRIRVGYRFGQT